MRWILIATTLLLYGCGDNGNIDAMHVLGEEHLAFRTGKADRISWDAEFRVKNTSNALVRIENVEASCSCIVPRPAHWEVAPGRIIELPLTVTLGVSEVSKSGSIVMKFSNGQILKLGVSAVRNATVALVPENPVMRHCWKAKESGRLAFLYYGDKAEEILVESETINTKISGFKKVRPQCHLVTVDCLMNDDDKVGRMEHKVTVFGPNRDEIRTFELQVETFEWIPLYVFCSKKGSEIEVPVLAPTDVEVVSISINTKSWSGPVEFEKRQSSSIKVYVPHDVLIHVNGDKESNLEFSFSDGSVCRALLVSA